MVLVPAGAIARGGPHETHVCHVLGHVGGTSDSRGFATDAHMAPRACPARRAMCRVQLGTTPHERQFQRQHSRESVQQNNGVTADFYSVMTKRHSVTIHSYSVMNHTDSVVKLTCPEHQIGGWWGPPPSLQPGTNSGRATPCGRQRNSSVNADLDSEDGRMRSVHRRSVRVGLSTCNQGGGPGRWPTRWASSRSW
jgi:hypothetical protein